MSEKMKNKIPKADELLEAGVHFGHQARRWHPRMEPFIFDKRNNVHILDLYKTEEALEAGCRFLFETAAKGGKIVFVGTKKQAKEIIENEAKRSGAMYVSNRWIGGTLTNLPTIKKSIDKLKTLIQKREAGELSHYTKKERLLFDREIERLENLIGGITGMTGRPDALFLVDVRREKTAVREAKRLGVPVVALVDTNSNPEDVAYVIPGNDDAIRSIALIVKTAADSVEEGYKEFAKDIEKAKAVESKRLEEEKAQKEKKLKAEEVKVSAQADVSDSQKTEVEVAKEAKPETAERKKRGRPKKISD